MTRLQALACNQHSRPETGGVPLPFPGGYFPGEEFIMYRKTLTQAQRDEASRKREEFKALCDRIAAMGEDEKARIVERMATVVNVDRHSFSVKNSCLIYMQCPNATIVGGFHAWKKMGRAVRKGEHGFKIWIPVERKSKIPGDDSKELGFMAGTVFDISQTDSIGQACEDRAEISAAIDSSN